MIKDADFYRAWAERMYRPVDDDCDNIILETHLRKVCVEGIAVWSSQTLMDTSLELLSSDLKFIRAHTAKMLMSTDWIIKQLDVV